MCRYPSHERPRGEAPKGGASSSLRECPAGGSDYASIPGVVVVSPHGYGARGKRGLCLLIVLSLVPFGGHLFKNALSALQPFLRLSATQYGALHSTFALANASFAPMLGGCLYDRGPRMRRWATPIFAAVAFLGGLVCASGLAAGDLALTYAGGLTLGLGQGCVVVACRAIASSFRDAAFAQGLLASVANLAAFVAKSGAAPVAAAVGLGGAVASLVAAQGLSAVAALAQGPKRPHHVRPHHARRRHRGWWARVAFLRRERFWLVAGCHGVFVCGFKVFDNFSSLILVRAYGYDPEKAGLVASVVPLASIFLAPLAGIFSDRHNSQLPCAVAMALALASFAVIALPSADSPITGGTAPLPVLAIALSHAALPTLLLARVRGAVDAHNVGAAFGACEFVVACGNVAFNFLFSFVHGRTDANEAVYLLLGLVGLGSLMFLRLLYLGDVDRRRPAAPLTDAARPEVRRPHQPRDIEAPPLPPLSQPDRKDDDANSEGSTDSSDVRAVTPRLWAY